MITISVVESTRPAGLLRCADTVMQRASALGAHLDTQRRAVAVLPAIWTGTAAGAATADARALLDRQTAVQTALTGRAAALRFGGTNLDALRSQILATSAQAVALGGAVADDGTVTAHTTVGLMTPTVAAAYTTSLKTMLATFDRMDRATAEALRTGEIPRTPALPHVSWSADDLYRGDPAGSDINQGPIGDCYLLATMGAVAHADPQWIRDRIDYDPRTGEFDVTLWNGTEWRHIAVTQSDIDANIAAEGGSGVDEYGRGAPLWPAVLESAYAKMKAPGAGIEGIEHGVTPPALEALTGNNGDWIVPATEWLTPSQNIDGQISEALAGNQPVMLSTSVFGGPLENMHVYSVEAITGTGSDAVVTMRNPWGPESGPPVIEARLGDLIGSGPLGGLGLGPTAMINIGRMGA